MKASKILLQLIVIAALSLLSGCSSKAHDPKIRITSLRVGRELSAKLYEPATQSAKSEIAILVMHPERDYTGFSACTELSKRGYRVLCAALGGGPGGGPGGDSGVSIDEMVFGVKAGVEYLRKYPGVKKVLLFGHSGGGAMMSAYQDIAENGLKACQGPEKLVKCSNRLAGLPPADGVLLVDSNWGLAAMTIFALDPAVLHMEDGRALNPALDMYNPANGYNIAGLGRDLGTAAMDENGMPKGPKPTTGSTYGDKFIRSFLTAEGKRNNLLVKTALDRVTALNSGKGHFSDDEPFILAGASQASENNKLYAQDIRLMSQTRKAWPLLHGNGTTTTEIVHSVRMPENQRCLTGLLMDGALKTTVREFLSTYAVRVNSDFGYDKDSVHGIDWSSSYNNPPGTVQGINVPMLVMGMTGHWEFLASETIYENARSSDKTLAFVEGANHTYDTCKLCEKVPGQFGDTQKTTYDYVDQWLSQKGRYMVDRTQ